MLDKTAMAAELAKLDSETIAQIHDALHELRGEAIQAAVVDLLWERHGTPSDGWPLQLRRLGVPPPIAPTHATCEVVGFCRAAAGPDDGGHVPTLTLDWAYVGERGLRRFHGFQCSCKRRLALYELRYRRTFESSDTRVWPIVRSASGERSYRMCRFAKGVDDLSHAPDDAFLHCMCGQPIGQGLDAFRPVQ